MIQQVPCYYSECGIKTVLIQELKREMNIKILVQDAQNLIEDKKLPLD